ETRGCGDLAGPRALENRGLSAAAPLAKSHPPHADPGSNSPAGQGNEIEFKGGLQPIGRVAGLARFERARSYAVVNEVRSPSSLSSHGDGAGIAERIAIGERRREPVRAPCGGVHTQRILGCERVVPEEVNSHARAKSEIDESRRKHARLVLA